MSTYQVDENDKPVTTHVDMGKIMRPKTSFNDKTANTDTASDTDRQTDDMVVARQTGGAQPGVATSGDSKGEHITDSSGGQGREEEAQDGPDAI